MKYCVLFIICQTPLIAAITGFVVDADSQAPIEGATVKIQFHEASTLTAADGSFSLDDALLSSENLCASAFHYYTGFVQISPPNPGPVMIELSAISEDTSEERPLNEPQTCAVCHPDVVADYDESPMGHSGLNQWVFDIWDGSATLFGMSSFVYKRDSVHVGASPNSECAACHSPTHYLTDDSDGMGDYHNPNVEMTLGVTCEVCHRALDNDADTKMNYPGVVLAPEGAFSILRHTEPVEFGLLGDSIFETAIMKSAYNPILSARLCSACHEDNNDHNDDGDYEDGVPSEATYSEWLDYVALKGADARSCVDCHMPPAENSTFCVFQGQPRPEGFVRSHKILGTTPEYLENALTLTVDSSVATDSFDLTVNLENDKTGHSVPSGVTVRNVLLLLLIKDSGDQFLPQLAGDSLDVVGGVDPGTDGANPEEGYYMGFPGKAFYFENTNGVATRVFYTEATSVVSDSRLKAGETYNETFTFSLPATGSPVDVDVRVIYRRAWRELIDAKGWTQTGLGDPLEDIQAPYFGHLMEGSAFSLDYCANRDLDGSGGVNAADVALLVPQWNQAAPPFGSETWVDVRHMATVVTCAQP